MDKNKKGLTKEVPVKEVPTIKKKENLVQMKVTSFRVGSVKTVTVDGKMYRITSTGDGDPIPESVAVKIENMEVRVSTPNGHAFIKPYRRI